MIKIIFIIDNLKIGGAQTHLRRLVDKLPQNSFIVKIICLGETEAGFSFKNAAMCNLRMDCIWKSYFWVNFFQLVDFLKKEKPFIVHTYLNTSNVFGVLAAKLATVPVIISSRRDLGHFRSALIGKLEKITAGMCDKVVCVSEAVKDSVMQKEKVFVDKLMVIYNGVDTEVFEYKGYKERKGFYNIAMVAAMDRKEKGHSYFIEAADEVIAKRKDVKFTLIGDGPLRGSFEKEVISKGLKSDFDFRGKRKDLHKELADVDILIVPSDSEGCSNALLEAMALGIPAVASAIEGNLEVIEDGVCGYLVSPKDPSAISKKVIKMLDNPAEINKIGVAARKRIENRFSLQEMVHNYTGFYEKLIQQKIIRQNKEVKFRDSSACSLRMTQDYVSGNILKEEIVGYVVSLFPCWSETFILNELLEVEKKGFDVTIFSIRNDLEDFIQEKARPLVKKTIYISYFGIIVSFFYWFIRKPFVIFNLFGLVFGLLRRFTPRNDTRDVFSVGDDVREISFPGNDIRVSSSYRNDESKGFSVPKNLWCILAGAQFARIARNKRITHIHAHFATYPAFTAMVINKLTDIPFSFTVHAHDIFLDKTLLKEKAEAAETIVAISGYNRNYLQNYSGNGVYRKTRVIHCGIDLNEYFLSVDLSEKKENVILSVGRFSEMKGFRHLINACHLIKEKVDFKCYIVGDGPLRGELEDSIKKYGLCDKVILLGVQDSVKIRELLNKATLFVLPSVWDDVEGQDGIPVVLMEAMAQGVPVISSRISGIPELVQDNVTGLLIEPGNERELAEKIKMLINNEELQKRLSLSGRLKVENEFNISKTADELVEVFQKSTGKIAKFRHSESEGRRILTTNRSFSSLRITKNDILEQTLQSQDDRKKKQNLPIKTLFIIWSLERGGAERFLVSLLKSIDCSIIAPTVCCLNWKGAWAKEVEDMGIEVIALNKKNGFDLAVFVKLVRFIKREKFKIVNTHLWGADSIGRIAAIFAGVPVIVSTAQNVDIWKKWPHRIVDKILSYKTDALIAVSSAVKRYYHEQVRIPEDKITVIPNAIELERFNNIGDVTYLYDELNLTSKDFILVCVGRLTEQKGQRYLLESIGNLLAKYENLRVVFVGDGEDKEKLIDLAHNLKVKEMVRFIGQRKDIPQILKLSNCLVLPSLYEGLPVCVLEAMAVGKPVIATDVGGTAEIINDGEDGFIIKAGNTLELTKSIEYLINNYERAKDMAEKAKLKIKENFSINSIAKKTSDLFLRLSQN